LIWLLHLDSRIHKAGVSGFECLPVVFCFLFCLFGALEIIKMLYLKDTESKCVSAWKRALVVSLKTGVLAEPVLVGRERELEELQHYLESAIDGRGTLIFRLSYLNLVSCGYTTSLFSTIPERLLRLL
jgi:hypothetical protein